MLWEKGIELSVKNNVMITEHKRHIISDKNFLSCRFEHTDYPYLHTHNYWEFMLVTRGTLLHKINGEMQVLEEGTLCLIRPNDSHMIKKISSEANHINFIVSDFNMDRQLKIIDPQIKRRILKKSHIFMIISERSTQQYMQNALSIQSINQDDPNYRLTLGRLFLMFMMDLIKYMNTSSQQRTLKAPQPVLQIISQINKEDNLHLSLTELAKSSGYSYVHLSRMFKEHMNMTLKEYFVSVRMNFGRLLLENTDKNIIEISNYIGYSSISHFNHTFKKRYHMTPTEYRKSWQDFYGSFEDE